MHWPKIFKFHWQVNSKIYPRHSGKPNQVIYQVSIPVIIELRGRETRNKDMFSALETGQDPRDNELDAVFLDSQLAQITSNERAISQREKEISEIAKSINSLATIFKDLQTMVIDQGTILDRIDYNIEQTAVHVEAAHEELVKVVPYLILGSQVSKQQGGESLYDYSSCCCSCYANCNRGKSFNEKARRK